MIYLDHAATTPLAPEVRETMLRWMDAEHGFGNPASDHALGRLARQAVEQARAQVAALIGAEPAEIVWTSGATEANNLALKGALEFRGLQGAHVITSRIEHKAVLDTCRHLETQGVAATYLVPDRGGRIDVQQVLAALRPETALVSLMWVNNEIGVINPVAELAPLLRERGILFHVDAVQATGKLPIDLATVPIDLLSVSAHKLYGPKGVGALFVRKRPRARLSPQMHGGGHEQGMRSGTLATHQIAGMGKAFEIARQRLDQDASDARALIAQAWHCLSQLAGVHRNSPPEGGAPNLLNLSFEGVDGEALRAALPGLALSSGSACSSATREPSYVLRALGRDDALAGASLRLSVGRSNSAEQIDIATAQVIDAVRRLRAIGGEGQEPIAPATLSLENVYGYSTPIWQRFCRPYSAGLAVSARAVQVGSPAAHAWVRLQMSAEEGGARFCAFGCPVTIAVAQWVCEWLAEPASQRAPATAASIRAALEIADDKAHCALMGEDLIRALPPEMTT